MSVRRLLAALVAVSFFAPLAALAQPVVQASPLTARVCPFAGEASPPDFTAPVCVDDAWRELDPQGRAVWIRLRIDVSPELLSMDAPLGLFVLGKASSRAWLNGELIGENGRPAAIREDEIPGRMDAVFFTPRDRLRAGANEVVLLASSHHGFIRLHHPIHWIAISPHRNPTDHALRRYWPSLVPLGALLVGTLYFGALAWRGDDRLGDALLAVAAAAASGQLAAEVSRGLFAYAYPLHDLRLIVVLGCAGVFGVALVALIARRFAPTRLRALTGGVAGTTIFLVFLIPGFDTKSAVAVLAPTFASGVIVSIAALRGVARARLHAVALFAFAGLISLSPSRFLDVYFYYIVFGLMLFLFAQQAVAHATAQRRRREEELRARQLEKALKAAEEAVGPTDTRIAVKSAGRMEFVAAHAISHCKGAGDYVELRLADGRDVLHSGTMAELEKSLPGDFLRVHRSYIVNAARLSSLKREANGVGELTMSNGDKVPVSRRIMPKIRTALG